MPLLRPAVSEKDTYLSKIIKYIPGEIIAAYTAAIGILNPEKQAFAENIKEYGWVLIGIILITPIWTYYSVIDNPNIPEESKKKQAIFHLFIATVSFMIWVYAIGDDLFREWWCNIFEEPTPSTGADAPLQGTSADCKHYNARMGSLILIFYTLLIVPLLERILLGKIFPPASVANQYKSPRNNR